MSRLHLHPENHFVDRIGWLRAAVLGGIPLRDVILALHARTNSRLHLGPRTRMLRERNHSLLAQYSAKGSNRNDHSRHKGSFVAQRLYGI